MVDDESQIVRALKVVLREAGFEAVPAETASEALDLAALRPPDAAIVDLVLPDGDGVEVTRRLREWSEMPILVLSALGDEEQKVRALEAGADDYITKPFGARELAARVQVALRHSASAGAAGAVLQIGAWSIDLKARTARDDGGRELHLTPTEYRLLEVLAQHIGLVVTHRTLLQQAWGPGSAQQTHYLRVYMKQLRAKLEPDPSRPHWLLTETGVGYRLAQRE